MRNLTAERWRRLEEILDRALDLAPEERPALLDRECSGDQALRSDLETLLHADALATSFLTDSADPYAAVLAAEHEARDSSSAGEWTGELLGPYRIVREIGRGGMGAVYLAERADGQFEHQVALKLVKRGLDSEEVHQRFLAERQILARLNHPNIARLLDGGRTPSGQPWFAMEHVEGEPITLWCDARRAGLGQRLDLFSQVCDAVRYAHQNLVVHRDLKPSNILVTSQGTVKLLDFGIAKLLHDEPSAQDTRTEVGLRVMTPEYAAPEQVRGEPVTTAVDVYALGAVLYELLTGHRAHRFAHRSAAEVERVVCDVAPSAPSSVVATKIERPRLDGATGAPSPEQVSVARALSPSRLRRALAGDLDNIVLTALRKEPARRYRSVEALLQDLQRYHGGLPVHARQDRFAYRARKFVRRNRAAVAAASLVLLSIGAGVAATVWQARSAARQAARATAVKDFVVGLFQAARPEEALGREVTTKQLLERGVSSIDTVLASEPELRAELLATLGSIHFSVGDFPRADSLFVRATREWETIAGGRDRPELMATLTGHALLLVQQSRLAQAESLLARAHAMSHRLYGPTDTTTLFIVSGLASVARQRDRLDEADSLHGFVLAETRRQLGENHTETARALANYAVVLGETGRRERADTLYRQALEIRRRQLPPDHPDVLLLLTNRGSLLRELGRYEESEALLRDALERRQRVQGDDHPDVAWAMTLLARVVETRGELSAAESLLAGALRIKRRLYEPTSPELAPELNNMGILNFRMERYDTAVAFIREALGIWRATLGPEAGHTLTAMNNLGAMLSHAGRHAEAEPLLREALRLRRKVFGEGHEAVGQSLRNLGVLLHRTARLGEAELTLRDAVRNQREAHGEDHPRVVDAELSLGELLVARGKAGEAELLLRGVLEARIAKLGDDHASVAEAQRALAECLAARGAYGEAERLFVASARILARDRYKRREAARTMDAMAAMYRAWGRPDKARDAERLAAG